jgi:5'-3' exonuclease
MTMGGKGKVLIDGDIVAYRAAFATQDQSPKDATDKVDDLMSFIIEATIEVPFASSGDYLTYLTGKGNFRFEIAKSHEYKGNRKEVPKPTYLPLCRDYLVDSYQAIVSQGEEADDLISKAAASLDYHCVVASIDKDMLQLPCWHFNFGRNEWTKVSPEEGIKFFYTQILTGDRADNIVGLHGIGPKKAEKLLQDCHTEEDLWDAVVKAYDCDTDRVIENARLLWLRRYEGQIWEPVVKREGS